jgi:hypothetical protein
VARLVRNVESLILAIFVGCGPTQWERTFNKSVEQSKKQYTSAQVRAAVMPLFAKYGKGESVRREDLPKEITELAIFAEDPAHIDAGWRYDDRNPTAPTAMMFTTGAGLHWGVVVFISTTYHESDPWFRKRLIPWGDGVYFFRQ